MEISKTTHGKDRLFLDGFTYVIKKNSVKKWNFGWKRVKINIAGLNILNGIVAITFFAFTN